MSALVKPVSLAGYEIAKPISKRNDAIRGKLAKALDFYSGRMSSVWSDGYSARISLSVSPSARLASTTETMILVPRMHALP